MIRFDDILEKVTSSFTEKDVNLLKKAYVFAARSHQGQERRSGEPYLSHPLEVARMLADMNFDVTTISAGLLHDVLEDTTVTAIDLQKTFGKDIALLVEGVTKISRVQESTPEKRQAESIRKIIIAMTDDLRVIFIKLADRIHNLKTLKFLPENKQRQIAKETLDIYAPIANRLGMGRIKATLEDLSFRYVDPDNYFMIASLVDPKKKAAEAELKKTKKAMEQVMKENKIPVDISYRIKRLYSIFNKINRQNVDFDQVYDFMALRIITDSIKNCYSALGIIHQKWPHLPHRFRDYIAMPKTNLYQALHTTIITQKKRMFEIQIRTHDMHAIAENGIAAHWRYKEADPQALMKEDRRLNWLREMVELYKEQKNPKEFLASLKINLIPEEVYVFTPKGKVITLPLGASALDFAFRIHSEIGFHASSAKINGKRAALKTILKTGDIVEIIDSPDASPKSEWLNIAFTSTARHHIKHWLNLQERKKNVSVGKKIWAQMLQKKGVPSPSLKGAALLKRITAVTQVRIRVMDEFFSLLGSGRLVLSSKVLDRILSSESAAQKKGTIIQKVVTRVSPKPHTAIQVHGGRADDIKLARCCSPIKGEPIVGYMTSGKGMTVHSLRCPLIVREHLNPHRMVEASWAPDAKGPYTGRLLIIGEDSPGVLADLTAIIAQQEGNISKAEVVTFSDKKGQIKLTLKIRDIHHLRQITKKILGMKKISSVERR